MEEEAYVLTSWLRNGCDKVLKSYKTQPARACPWWNQDLNRRKKIVRQCLKHDHLAHDTPRKDKALVIYKNKLKEYKNAIIQAKQISWKTFVEEKLMNDPYKKSERQNKILDNDQHDY